MPNEAGSGCSVIRVSSGNFLEMYDFFVFGYYASAIGKAFSRPEATSPNPNWLS